MMTVCVGIAVSYLCIQSNVQETHMYSIGWFFKDCSVLQCVAVCCSVLQCVAVCCSVLQCVAMCYSVLQCVAVCCSVSSRDVYV